MRWIFYVLSPVLIHLVLSEGIAVFAGNVFDSAACTALSAVLVIPVAAWMYRQDVISHLDGASRHGSDNGRKNIRHLGWYLVCFLFGGAMNVIWSGFLSALRVTSFFSNQTQEALLGSQLLMQVLGPGLLVPVAEELIFRGLVYGRMKTRLCVRQAVLFSALLFALYHGNPIQMIYAFPMALLLAMICERDGTLVGPVLFHMGANLTAIFFSG